MRVYNRLNVPMNGKTMQPKIRMSFANGRFVINPEACRVMDLFARWHINIYYEEKSDMWLIGGADETGFLLKSHGDDYSLVFHSKYLIGKIFESISYQGNVGNALIIGPVAVDNKKLWHINLDSFRNS